jgi:hypothetical protein
VLIYGTNVADISAVLAARFTGMAVPAKQVSSGIYNLMWTSRRTTFRGPKIKHTYHRDVYAAVPHFDVLRC